MKDLNSRLLQWISVIASVAIAVGTTSCGGGDDGGDDGDPKPDNSGGGSDPKPDNSGGGAGPKPDDIGGGAGDLATVFSRAQAIKEIQRLRQCALAVIIYSSENDGKFPSADELASVIKTNAGPSLLYVGGAEEGDPLLYAAGMSEDSPYDLALLASPVKMAGKRAVGFRDGSVRPLDDAQFAAEQAKLKEAGFELK